MRNGISALECTPWADSIDGTDSIDFGTPNYKRTKELADDSIEKVILSASRVAEQPDMSEASLPAISFASV